MIEVQVRVDDNVDLVRGNAGGGEVVEQLGRLAIKLDHAVGELVAHTGLDQHGLLAGANHERVKTGSDVVAAVGFDPARPHHFRDNAEECSAVERVSSIRKDTEFEVAER